MVTPVTVTFWAHVNVKMWAVWNTRRWCAFRTRAGDLFWRGECHTPTFSSTWAAICSKEGRGGMAGRLLSWSPVDAMVWVIWWFDVMLGKRKINVGIVLLSFSVEILSFWLIKTQHHTNWWGARYAFLTTKTHPDHNTCGILRLSSICRYNNINMVLLAIC